MKDDRGVGLDIFTNGYHYGLEALKECKKASVIIRKLLPLFVQKRQECAKNLRVAESITYSLCYGAYTVKHGDLGPILIALHYRVENLKEAYQQWLTFLWHDLDQGGIGVAGGFLNALLLVRHLLDEFLMVKDKDLL